MDHDVADEFFAVVVRRAKLRRYVSSDHFSVDGTLLNAWASHKSFKPKDDPPSNPPAGRNSEVGWRGQKRSNEQNHGGGHKLRYIGRQRNRAWFTMNAAVYNLIRITALDTQPA